MMGGMGIVDEPEPNKNGGSPEFPTFTGLLPVQLLDELDSAILRETGKTYTTKSFCLMYSCFL
jgi:hypothetical protein